MQRTQSTLAPTVHEPWGFKTVLPWTSLQSSIHNIWSGLHMAPLDWAGTEDHIHPEGLYKTLSFCGHPDHSWMNTGASDRKIRKQNVF